MAGLLPMRLSYAMTGHEGIVLPPTLLPDARGEAALVLKAYFAPLSARDAGFTGGAWDAFDPSGTRAASANTFTADDIVACSLLGTPIGARAAIELVDRQRRRFEVLLEQVGPDVDFVDLESMDTEPFTSVRRLYQALDSLPQIGETRATKLLARKRPRLVPIVDSVVRTAVFGGAARQWQPLHHALRANDQRLWHQLLEIRTAAGLSEAVSGLRVFDVLAWMHGTGNATRVLNGHLILPDAPAEG